MPAIIHEMAEINDSQVLIKLMINDCPLLAKITKKSAADLNLKNGSQVYAQVKTMALLS